MDRQSAELNASVAGPQAPDCATSDRHIPSVMDRKRTTAKILNELHIA
jgi:hypothetical protein